MKEYTLHLMDGKEIKTHLKEGEEYINGTYKRAKIAEKNGVKDLYSYETRVARITKSGEFIRIWDGYSQTTMKHVNEFRRMNGMNSLSAKEWKALPVNKSSKKKWVFQLETYDKKGKVKSMFQYELHQVNTAINKASNYLPFTMSPWQYLKLWTDEVMREKEEDAMSLNGAQLFFKQI